jgi:hypothetical protein
MNVTFANPSRTTPFPERPTHQPRHGKCPLWCKAVPLAIACTAGLSLACLTGYATAQTDVEADPAHHRQLFENDKVRVVRVTYGPREKAAAMFDAKEVVIVTLTSGAQRLNFPDGTFADPPPFAAGAVFFAPAGRIQPENFRNERLELIVVEPKSCK